MIGGEASAGTLYNGVTLQSTIRLGKMLPYFSGYINRFTSARRLQAYFMIKPQASIVIHNTLLDGSLFHDYPEPDKAGERLYLYPNPVHWLRESIMDSSYRTDL